MNTRKSEKYGALGWFLFVGIIFNLSYIDSYIRDYYGYLTFENLGTIISEKLGAHLLLIILITVLVFIIRKLLRLNHFEHLQEAYGRAKVGKYHLDNYNKLLETYGEGDARNKISELEYNQAMLYKNHFQEYLTSLVEYADRIGEKVEI